MSTIKFRITNITCASCVKLSTISLEKITGVKKAIIDAATGSVELVAEREVAWSEITAALESVGKEAVILN